MEYSSGSSWLALSLLAAIIFLFLLRRNKAKNGGRRPPGPPRWPVIGNMLELGSMPHRSLFKLKAQYGPVVWLKLGFVNTVVVQSAKAAEELFKNHDLVFADRKCPEALTAYSFNELGITMNRYSSYWRVARKICASELLGNRRLNEHTDQRRQSISNLILSIEEKIKASHSRGEPGEVDICHLIIKFYMGLIGNLSMSRDVLKSESNEEPEFLDAMVKVMEVASQPNVSDFLPFLRWLDPQGIKRNMVREMGRCIKASTQFVNERVEKRKSGIKKVNKDLLDMLLDSEGEEGKDKLSEQNIIILILEMFLGGSETSSASVEWAMAAAMRYPDQRRKIREEIDQVVGLKRMVEENDIDNMPYLRAFVKEIFRLFVTAPLLPRNTREDTNYMGYLIPKDTQVIVNSWGIARDPESWDEPEAFKPERFLESDLDYRGKHYEYLPFGSGRRICAGVSLAHRTVPVIFANLLQHFDWDLKSGITPETMNMEEKLGLSLRRLVPLRLIAKKRSDELGN